MKATTIITLLIPTTLGLSIPTSDDTNTTLINSRSFAQPVPNFEMTLYQDINCEGNAMIKNDATYGTNYEIVKGLRGNLYGAHSYYLSRDLLPGEQLDWSRPGTPHDDVLSHNCATYYKSAPGQQAKGCQPLGVKVSCFKLWLHSGH